MAGSHGAAGAKPAHDSGSDFGSCLWPVELGDLEAKRYALLPLPLTNVLQAGPVVRLYRRRKLAMTACRMRYMGGEERFFRLRDDLRQMTTPR